ncbi:hypothetical protein [Nonomuraea candida]|uniref:hypothetical protein n=1 Tax=Nonomuraea candida TaxID=359159 RepID=UPI001FE04AAE|nr:hypothetical protein [Nonomuraea candida]
MGPETALISRLAWWRVRSKLANLLFTFELQRRAERAGADLISVATRPGSTATGIIELGPLRPLAGLFLKPPERGAVSSLYAAREVQHGVHPFRGERADLGRQVAAVANQLGLRVGEAGDEAGFGAGPGGGDHPDAESCGQLHGCPTVKLSTPSPRAPTVPAKSLPTTSGKRCSIICCTWPAATGRSKPLTEEPATFTSTSPASGCGVGRPARAGVTGTEFSVTATWSDRPGRAPVTARRPGRNHDAMYRWIIGDGLVRRPLPSRAGSAVRQGTSVVRSQ